MVCSFLGLAMEMKIPYPALQPRLYELKILDQLGRGGDRLGGRAIQLAPPGDVFCPSFISQSALQLLLQTLRVQSFDLAHVLSPCLPPTFWRERCFLVRFSL